MCRHYFGPVVLQVARQLGLEVPGELTLISDAPGSRLGAQLPWPSVSPELDYAAQTALVGRMLCELMDGKRPDPAHVVIPVHLVEP